MSEKDISLFELVNLSIGTPDVGAVNFNALHLLLHAMLRQLDIREVKTKWREAPPGPTHTKTQGHLTSPTPTPTVELELPNGTQLPSPPPPPSSITVDDSGLKDLHSRIQTNQDGVSEALELIQDLLKEIHSLKESVKELHLHMEKMNVGALAERLAAVEKCCHRVDDLENTTRSLRDAAQRRPDPEELSQFVTWDDMQAALLGERENLQRDLVSSGADLASEGQTGSTPVSAAPPDANQPPAVRSSKEPTQDPVTRRGSADPGDPVTFSTPPQTPITVHLPSSPVPDNAHAGAASSPADHQQRDAPAPTETKTPSAKANGAARYPETVAALRNLSKLRERSDSLEARVKDLQAHKADQAQLANLKELIKDRGGRDVDDNLLDELNHQRTLIDSLMGDREKNVELVNNVQKVQAECAKLHKSSRRLDEDGGRKQRHIEQLYKRVEELDEKKADKQLVRTEIEIKADKCALDNTVSRVQFDSVTERLSAMFHELLSKVSNQDHDWQKVIDKVYTEMECKSNRNELDSMRRQLEDRWRNTYRKLQSQTAPEQDDAAVVRKQLLDRFHCLSCDRPIAMHTPGPQCVALPCAPGLPAHKSYRPYTVYGRQRNRSERFPEKCSSLRVSPTRRHPRVPHDAQDVLTEMDGVFQREEFEVDAFGQDGPVYRQRLNSPALRYMEDKLPTVSRGDKAKRFLSHKPRGSPELRCTPAPPHSAKGQRSRSASADPCLEEGPSSNL